MIGRDNTKKKMMAHQVTRERIPIKGIATIAREDVVMAKAITVTHHVRMAPKVLVVVPMTKAISNVSTPIRWVFMHLSVGANHEKRRPI